MTDDIYSRETRFGEENGLAGGDLSAGLVGFEIKREVGRGGMGVVYEALEKSLNRVVALKVMGKDFGQDKELLKRFINEAQAAARLNHPNIVQIYSIGEEKGVYYFVMEYVKGTSVEGVLAEGKRFSVKDSLNVIRQTVSALKAAYNAGIVHRDIKPGNLLITEQGVVKVADFGLAAEIKDAPRIVKGKIIGTPFYMSPEQAQGKESDHRSDMYSMGITFYHMLSGTPPFISSETKEIIRDQIEKHLPPLAGNVPQEIVKFIDRLTQKDPDNRFKDYDVLAKAVDKLCGVYVSKRRVSPLLLTLFLVTVGVVAYTFLYRPVMREIIFPPKVEKDRRVEKMYRDVVKYARQHPESYGEIIKEYFRILREYPNTEWSLRAEQKIDMIILTVVSEAAEELKKLKLKGEKLTAEDRYQELIDEYLKIKEKYKDTAAENIARENIDYIYEQARKKFVKVQEEAGEFLSRNEFKGAREVYEHVINVFGIQEFVEEAGEKIAMIDGLEQKYIFMTQARSVYDPVEQKVNLFLDKFKFKEARSKLQNIQLETKNPVLEELIQSKMNLIDEMQIEYESKVLKEKMDTQYGIYRDIQDKVDGNISEFMYDRAIDIVSKGVQKVEILKWRLKLENMLEELIYLRFIKERIIDGINEHLLVTQSGLQKNILADNNDLILIVDRGFVGIPWKECSPEKIYELGQEYIENDNPNHHIALGVFCLVYGMYNDSRKEFTFVLHLDPEKKGVIEKYLTQLAEAEK